MSWICEYRHLLGVHYKQLCANVWGFKGADDRPSLCYWLSHLPLTMSSHQPWRVWWTADLPILVLTSGSLPWLCSVLDLWTASVSSILSDLLTWLRSICWVLPHHGDTLLVSFLDLSDSRKRGWDPHEGRFDGWFCTRLRKRKVNKYLQGAL